MAGRSKDNRLVSMSCSGGEAALIADMAMEKKVRFPEFDSCTKPKVAATLNEYVAIDNPLDYHTFIWNQEDKLTATFSAVLAGGFDVGDAHPRYSDQPGDAARYLARHRQGAASTPPRRPRRAPRWWRACPNACRSTWPKSWQARASPR